VVLTDISLPLLRHAEARAIQRDVFAQCELVHSAADDLKDIPTASVDAVTTRAVLAYVADKPAALRQFHRILKPGGRISIAEPILQDEAFNAIALKARVDASGPESGDRVLALLHRWKAAQFPDTLEKLAKSPIANYSERDLLRFVNECGFVETHLEFHIDTRPGEIASWETFLGSSPHPWAPTAGTILAQQFTAEEQQILEQMVRPAIESGRSTAIDRVAYVSATKRTVPS
jgi:ubiquinone/menaquinone biosynthesis C-methylase UbiE